MKSILDLVAAKGIEVKRVASTKGGEYHGPCPGCGGSDRFHVWPDQNEGAGSFWCRSCDIGGDGITFLMEFEGLSFADACREIGRELDHTGGVTAAPSLPKGGKGVAKYEPVKPGAPVGDLWAEKAGSLVDWAHKALLADPAPVEWLQARGIRTDMAVRHRLGWNRGRDGRDIWRPRESWGLETITKENGQRKRLWFPRGLLIPTIDRSGRVRRIRVRRWADDPPRYYVIPGSNMGQTTTSETARAHMVVESDLDSILIEQMAGDWVGVVALGSSHTKPDSGVYGVLKASPVLLLAMDFDKAGQTAMEWWGQHFPRSKPWPVPKGKDPGEAYSLGVDIRQWVLAGLPRAWVEGTKGPSTWVDGKGGGAEKEGGQAADRAADPGGAGRKIDEAAPVLAEGVRAFIDMLKRYPLQVYSSAMRTQIREPGEWAHRNWEASKMFSQLVFFNEDVRAYINGHPDRLITRKNATYNNQEGG